jgi:alanine dehydrogenase
MADQQKQKAFASPELIPQAEMLEIKKSNKSLSIGVPKEITFQENRIGLAPGAVALLVKNGHRIIIESDAGKSAHFYDNQYSEAGAAIAHTTDEVFQADIILKVGPPDDKELGLMKPRQTLISALHLPSQNQEFFKTLSAKKSLAIAYELIRDRTKTYPVLRAMSEIAGNTSILIASEYLCHPELGKGHMLGGFSGISPTDIVILGAGTVGEFAARAAIGLGAQVKIFDNSIYKLRRLQCNVNARVFTSIMQPEVLLKALKTADVVVGALYSDEGRTPWVVTEEMVMQMKPRSVIVDVSIDQGGCIETSHPTNHTNPVFVSHDVIHYCVPNIASRVPHTASYALSNIFAPMILKIGNSGGIENFIRTDHGLMHGVYMFNGTVTNKYVGESFNIPYQDIELLMAAYR